MSTRWKRRIGIALIALAAAALALVTVLGTGMADRWMQRALIRQIEQKTGARAEIGAFHLDVWRLRAEIDGLTLHGLEPADAPPLFHADRVDVGIRILSFFGRRFALDELIVERPLVAIRVGPDGHSNLPTPPRRARSRPWQETLFDLQIGRLALWDGGVIFNDWEAPLAVEGQDLEFTLHFGGSAEVDGFYAGTLRWQQVQMAQGRGEPFRFDLSAKFTLRRNAFELDELVCELPHSELNLRAERPDFSRPDWNLWYRGRLALADVRTIFRSPKTPDGITDFSGHAHYGPGVENENAENGNAWTAAGYFRAHDIQMSYQWFHASGMETWGDYEEAQRHLVVPNLGAQVLGGKIDGRLELDLHDFAFRTETHLRGAGLAAILNALNNRSFPVRALHWDGSVDVDSVNTWDHNFKRFRTTGETRWSPPERLAAGMIPATARIDYDYAQQRCRVDISASKITMPKTQLNFDGMLGAADSALEVKFHTGELLDWDDFINILRGPHATPRRISGEATWRGRILGPIVGPTFAGQVHVAEARYDRLYWDSIDGSLEYSPDGFRLTNTAVRRGNASVVMGLSLEFDDWDFLPENSWSLNARVEHASAGDVQAIVGTNYPVGGALSGELRGSGTRAAPVLDADFAWDGIEVGGFRYDRLTGEFHWEHDEIRLTNAALRRGPESIAGDVSYRPAEQQVAFNIDGAGIPLGSIGALQTAALPIGGELGFHFQGKGPLEAPGAQGDFRLANLKLGAEVEGNFSGQVESDDQIARISLESALSIGKLRGQVLIGLHGDRLISGQLTAEQFDLDPLITAGLHLKQPTTHSSVDGTFTITGALRRPDSIEVKADITHISFGYESVELANDGDIRLSYRRNEVRVEQAHLHGADTDLQFSGAARFDGDRPLRFALSGGANLRLLEGMLPDLDAEGRAQVNVAIEGTFSRPQITGRASVTGASAHYADFPLGLSNTSGDFVFDQGRLLFDRVTGEAGGGQITLAGSVSYGEGPLRYEISARTSLVRIRYPPGMSWRAEGTVELSGTSNAALVSGHVQVERLLFAQGVDIASFFAAASQPSAEPVSASPFLQNLAFDVEARTNPGARIEWSGAHVEMDGDVRLRGTWDRPVLIGHIHLLSGEMPFRGNTFELTRGDINFANPFRLDPVLNIEMTSTISQYQVTIDFTGPASRLSMNYRSDPPLPDSDVIALLALGNTGEAGGLRSQSAAGSQNYGATALLSEAISTGIGGRIEHLFGLSQFRVDPFVSDTATESNPAARITVQEHVAHNMTITYSTNAATTNQFQMIQVEYAIKRDLSVDFLRDVNGLNGLDIKWVRHFK